MPAGGQQLYATAKPSTSLPICGKRGRTDVHAQDARKRLKQEGSPGGVVPQTPTSFQREVALATLPDTGYDPERVAASGSFPRGRGGFPSHRATRVGAGTLVKTKDDLRQKLAAAEARIADLDGKLRHLYKIHDRAEDTADAAFDHSNELRERVIHLEPVTHRVQALELGQARLGGQLGFLLRLQNLPVAPPPEPPSAPGPPNPPWPGHDTA